uniref:DNA ligase (ATP) (EC) n=1 Tax=uncultured Thiotrichaceae bacterium TaxID=298394 RepID=A0A6S6UC64_9GAMM|nr:MAG: DNA ligase (ATP) (EC [uncultured Thiotrichaceae bacterium]
MKKINSISLLVSVILSVSPLSVHAESGDTPQLLLAKVYKKSSDLSHYWASEKYDGVRAYWNGQQFISRQGNVYHAPDWFTQSFPKHPLDGELWLARNSFEQLLSTVSKDTPVDDEWRQLTYRVFELPEASGTFSERIVALESLLNNIDNPYLKLVEQYRVRSHKALMEKLDDVVNAGAEGLMLHHENAVYTTGRSDDLLKVKRYEDAEARVIRHLPGKGKYTGMMGALLLETPEGIRFKIGSGFSDAERQHPPAIDSVVTYKYYGRTKRDKPRFASFIRVWE